MTDHQELQKPQGGIMTNEKPTQGKWHVDGWDLCAVIAGRHDERYQRKIGYVTVFKDIDNQRDMPLEERKANARLIAAAPELLEALDDMLAMIYEGVPKAEWPAIQAKAKAAIVKARATTAM